MSLSSGVPEERRPVSDGGGAHKEEAHPAVSAHPGHARAAAGDRSLHPHYWGLQVDQAQVRGVSLLCTSAIGPTKSGVQLLSKIQLWKKIRDHTKLFLNLNPHMYGSHSIPVSVEFLHRELCYQWFIQLN